MTHATGIAWDLALGRTGQEDATADPEATERRRAFGRLVREHAGILHSLARRLAPTAADAEDLVQETLLKAWRGLSRFRQEADLRTWLYRILVNASRDRARRRRDLPHLDPEAEPEPGTPDPAGGLFRRDLLARVLAAVEVLPRRQRECLLLRVRAGLSHREIASLLGIQEGVVKVHLVHARRSLLARFGPEVLE